MSATLRILFIEDSEDDASLLLRHLRQGGYTLIHERVDTPEAMAAALERGPWDLLLSDYSMPRFSALAALSLLQETGRDIPFILVSGTVGDDVAVSALKAGAHDFIAKHQPARLIPAIERELREADLRREHRAAQQALVESEERLRLALRAGRMGTWEWDIEANVAVWSREIAEMHGLEAEGRDATFDAILDRIHAADRDRIMAAAGAAIAGDGFQILYRLHHPDGTTHWVESRGQFFTDQSGRPQRIIGISSDVTERVRSEEALRESEEYFRALIENGAEFISVIGADGKARYVSPSYERNLGYEAGELVGAEILRITHPDDLPRVLEAFDGLVRGQQATAEMELRILHRDGSERTIVASAKNMLDVAAVRGIVVNAYDVTERKTLEAQFLQAQKMEAVGRLAGGVAHDFNNLLTGIQGYTDFVLEDTPPSDPRRADLEEIRHGAERAAVLTRQLLAFSRRQLIQRRVLSLADTVASTQKMLRRLIGEDVELKILAAPDLGMVQADPGQMEQVLFNLVLNARDAMPEGGTVTVELANAERTEAGDGVGAPPQVEGYVRLTVADTGSGMDRQTLARIFEPFFTTKPQGKGTGLGLSTVYGIVQQSGGAIHAASEPGEGTRFDLYLPRTDHPVEPHAPTLHEGTALGGTETVLLVEDEPAVRALASRVLRRAGYAILEATDGAEALRLVETHRGPIDLLLTDVVMPQMSGIQVAAAVCTSRPDTRVLVMSGYTEEAIAERGVYEAGVGVLEKPFSPEELLRKVRETLDSSLAAGGPPDHSRSS